MTSPSRSSSPAPSSSSASQQPSQGQQRQPQPAQQPPSKGILKETIPKEQPRRSDMTLGGTAVRIEEPEKLLNFRPLNSGTVATGHLAFAIKSSLNTINHLDVEYFDAIAKKDFERAKVITTMKEKTTEAMNSQHDAICLLFPDSNTELRLENNRKRRREDAAEAHVSSLLSINTQVASILHQRAEEDRAITKTMLKRLKRRDEASALLTKLQQQNEDLLKKLGELKTTEDDNKKE